MTEALSAAAEFCGSGPEADSYFYPTACFVVLFFFFFQAEDGIRDLTVTGVQTCALPIFMTVFPCALKCDARTTVPALAASAGVPLSARKSIPLWNPASIVPLRRRFNPKIGRASCRERV